MRRPLKIRQGAMGGFVLSMITAGGAAGRSNTPWLTFAAIATVGLVCTGLVIALGIAINRRNDSSGPSR